MADHKTVGINSFVHLFMQLLFVYYVPNIEASGKLKHSLCPRGAYSLQMRDK